MQFGEIIEPSSRALWVHDNDEETGTTSAELSWSKQSSVPDEIKKLIIFEGKIAVDFAENCIVSGSPSATISGVNVNIYHLAEGLVVCICQGQVNELGGKVTALLEPWISKAGTVIAVQTSPKTTYLGPFPDAPYILGVLSTSAAKKINSYNPLERPNMLTGITAGVLSYCEHIGLPGTAWCMYASIPPYGTDSTSTKPINELLNTLQIPISNTFKCKPKITSNLYM